MNGPGTEMKISVTFFEIERSSMIIRIKIIGFQISKARKRNPTSLE